MTGLGVARSQCSEVSIEIVLRSFNQRGLEIKYRLPDELCCLEPHINSMVHGSLCRGRIEVQVKYEFLSLRVSEIVIDEEKLKTLLHKLAGLHSQFPKSVLPVTMSDLLSLPGVVKQVEHSFATEEIIELGKEVLKASLTDLVSSREQEGKALKANLSHLFVGCLSLIESIDSTQNKDLEKRFESFRSRIEALCKSFDLDQGRLYQEFALMAERSDFKEEIDRLKAHAKHFDILCQRPGAKGRKLDFLCQEMLRESNTLMSKAFDDVVTVKAIELKAEFERIREQVQNIE
jgi:uncharacterized protein (TIGR00255 family)